MPHALVSIVVLAVAVLAASADAAAMGFGSVRSATLLGQPLNLAIPVRLDDDEGLEAECVRAEVHSGDERIAPGDVRVRVTRSGERGERLIRVTTSGAINEPVVTVKLTAGCPPRLSREFVTFADPPEFQAAQARRAEQTAAAAPRPAEPPTPPGDAEPGAPTEPAPGARVAAPVPRSEAAPARRAARPPQAQARPSRPRPPRAEAAPRRSVAAAPAPGRARQPEPPPARPRLRLDVVEPMPAPVDSSQQAIAAQEQASAAFARASAAQAAASAADARLRVLEAEMARLHAQAQADRAALAQLRARAPASTDPAARFLPWLIALLALLVVLAIGLGWRLLQLSRTRVRGNSERWYGPSGMPESAHGEDPPAPQPTTTAGAAVSGPVPLVGSRVQAAPSPPRAREVTVEEQIDLEQQADFFIALGQEDAAVDLLLTHLRGTGGTSPMPYLKLIEIHRRRNERDAYDRMRERFNQRFNGVVPEWDEDPAAGRSLGAYPAALARVQRLWGSPLDAMAELESMLFRRGEGAELFELPAYLDVLLLYQVARDLHQNEQEAGASAPTAVDVLLPLGGVAADDPASVPADVERTATFGGPAAQRKEPISLDLDLSLEERLPGADADADRDRS